MQCYPHYVDVDPNSTCHPDADSGFLFLYDADADSDPDPIFSP
jgi:hypothetical protein